MGARSVFYLRYLNSWEWKFKRWAVFRERGRRCERCGASDYVDVHHRIYRRLGRERMEDLEVLCTDCHAFHHGLPAPAHRNVRPLGTILRELEAEEPRLRGAA